MRMCSAWASGGGRVVDFGVYKGIFYLCAWAVPELVAVDEMGQAVREKYFIPGGTIELRCLVTNYREDFALPVWSRGGPNGGSGGRLVDERNKRR